MAVRRYIVKPEVSYLQPPPSTPSPSPPSSSLLSFPLRLDKGWSFFPGSHPLSNHFPHRRYRASSQRLGAGDTVFRAIRPAIQLVLSEMPAGQLLVGGSAFQTYNRVSGDACTPINGRWWHCPLLFPRLQFHQTDVGLLQGSTHSFR